MRYNLISYLIGDGIKNIAKNKKSTFTAITIMVVTMITIGICYIIGENVKVILNKMETSYPIEVYISDGTTDSEKETLKNEIKKIEYVNSDNITFINKKDAFHYAQDRLGESALSAGMIGYTEDVHPFPEMYIVTLSNLDQLDEVVSKLESLDYVLGTSESEEDFSIENSDLLNESNGNGDESSATSETGEQSSNSLSESNSTNKTEAKKNSSAENLTHFHRSVNIALFVIGGGLIIFSIIIIGNTIKLTVHARRKEISIMKYVGATNNFIRAPFVVEGIIIGIISSLISVILVGGLYIWIKKGIIGNTIQRWLTNLNNMSTGMENLLQFDQMFGQIMLIFLVIGIGIGVFGSIISMKKYLKV